MSILIGMGEEIIETNNMKKGKFFDSAKKGG